MEAKNPTQSLSSPPPPPPRELPEQPPLKKPKMSSTTTTSDDETAGKPHRYKRRKVAIFFAYCGVGYQGMQKNPGAKTIEGDLEEALFFAGAVPEADRGQPKRFDWARSARTDKGVSAVGQVVSGRFYVDPPGFVQRLNSNLSPQIRIFGYKRVTPSFNAKKFCDRRRYVYLLPVFALDPTCHRDRESVLASLGSGNELAKCVACSERGRKVIGLMGNRKDWDSYGLLQSGISLNINGSMEVLKDDVVAVVDSEVSVQSGISSNNGDASLINEDEEKNVKDDANMVESEVLVHSEISSNNEAALLTNELKEKEDNNEVLKEKISEFKYGEEERKRFNRILKHYVGTHNFHNFTTRTKAEDPSAKRYIVSFEANTTLSIEGIDFVKCEVIGQSFMLHQIRKMMGMAVAVMRNFVPESIYEKAFDQDFNINVPTAPEVGLYLDECFFTSYNNKWKNTHEEISMKDYAEEAEEFKLKYIYSHVAKTEHKEGSVAVWLHSLNHRNYPDFRPPNAEVDAPANDDGEIAANEVDKAANDDGERAANEVDRAANDDGERAANEVDSTANDDGERATNEVDRAANDDGERAANEVDRAANDDGERAANEVDRAANDGVQGVAEGDAMDVLK